MSYKKTHDLTVKVGTYEKDGETKGRYINVGTIMKDEEGKTIILLNRTFNPAGVPNPDGKDSIILNRMEIKDDKKDDKKNNNDDI